MRKRFFSRTACWLVTALVLWPGFKAPGAEQYFVAVDASGFLPDRLTINAGDAVLWLNLDQTNLHTTTSDKPVGDPDYWNATLGYFNFFTHVFLHAGTFTYRDSLGGLTGTVIVRAADPPRLGTPRVAGSEFLFEATGLTAGKTNLLQSSTNLTVWVAIRTNTASSSSMTFTHTAGPRQRFYRLIELR